MNPGIFYLYEYSNTQKLRNTGFLKITRYYSSCTLQLNARGIPVSYVDKIKLYVFYTENNLAKAAMLTEINCANHALSARMTFAESEFPDGHSLNQLDGFFLRLPNGHILAAATPGIAIDAQKLLSSSDRPSAENASAENISDEMTAPAEGTPNSTTTPDIAEQTNEVSDDPEKEAEPSFYLEAESVQECNTEIPQPDTSDSSSSVGQNPPAESEAHREQGSPSESESLLEQSSPSEPESLLEQGSPSEPESHLEQSSPSEPECLSEQEPQAEQSPPAEQESRAEQVPSTEPSPHSEAESQTEQKSSPEQCSPRQSVRKIQRSDLSKLPRKYWYLANCSFLLHGYHNYNHLILIEKDGHYWLGVPGIYDPREARAARLFGFPQFTDSYNKYLELSDDECSPDDNFGYWCCYLK